MRGFGGLGSLKDLAEKSKVLDKGLGYLLLPLDDVVSKTQVRKRFKGIEELAETIRQDQLQSPIQVAPKNEDGKYVILRGERRWRACKLLGMKEIKAIIDDTQYDGMSLLIGEMVENVQREDLDPIEIAQGMQELIERFGAKPSEIAERLGKSRSYVSMHLSIAENLPQCAADLIADGLMMGAETLYILGQLEKDAPAAVAALCEAARSEGRGVTRGEARDAQRAAAALLAQQEKQEQPSVEHPAADATAPIERGREQDEPDTHGESHFDATTGSESFAGETISDASEQNEQQPAHGSSPAPAKPAAKSSPVAIDLMVSVLVDEAYQKGAIAWNRKAPREGYVFVTLDDGSVRSFPLSEVQLLDVRNVETGEAV